VSSAILFYAPLCCFVCCYVVEKKKMEHGPLNKDFCSWFQHKIDGFKGNLSRSVFHNLVMLTLWHQQAYSCLCLYHLAHQQMRHAQNADKDSKKLTLEKPLITFRLLL
jgi:hypothetical protein